MGKFSTARPVYARHRGRRGLAFRPWNRARRGSSLTVMVHLPLCWAGRCDSTRELRTYNRSNVPTRLAYLMLARGAQF